MNSELTILDRDAINELPLGCYEGQVHIISTYDSFLAFLPLLQNESVLGFDTETKPTFRKGKYNYPALVQLACQDAVFLIQINQTGFIPELISLMTNAQQVKVGVGIKEDFRELVKLQEFTPSGVVDLGATAKKYNLGIHSLRGLTASFLGFRISKTAQCSNWSQPDLSPQQIKYAATDAWVSREIYLRFIERGYL